MGNTVGSSSQRSGKKPAILAVGASGTGKSSVLGLLTGRNVKSGGGSQSVTSGTSFYEEDDYFYIDTQGWMDSSREKKDYDIQSEILQELQDKNIDEIKVIWCCNPDIRATSQLQEEAGFINLMKDRDIWDSVLILEKMPFRSHEISSGVKEAAKRRGAKLQLADSQRVDNSHPHYLGLWVADWGTEEERKFAQQAKVHHIHPSIMGNKDAKEKVRQKLDSLKTAQVLFFTKKCTKCLQTFDKRIPPKKCHGPPEMYHSDHEATVMAHPGHLDDATYAPHGGVVGGVVTAAVGGAALGPAGIIFGAHGGLVSAAVCSYWTRYRYYSCCDKKEGSAGCQKQFNCCNKKYGKNVERDEGTCKKLCSNCRGNMKKKSKGCAEGGPGFKHIVIDA